MTGLGLVLKAYFFLYFGCTGHCCGAQAFFVAVSGGYSSFAAWDPQCWGLSCCGVWTLGYTGFSSWHTGLVVPQRVGSSQCVCMCAQLCPTLCSPVDCSMPGSSVRWISRNTRVGCHFLLQGMLLSQGLNPPLLHWQADSLSAVPPGKAIFLDQGSNRCSLHCKADS